MINEMQRLKALCTRDEFQLYRESLGTRLERLSSRDLRSRVRRARNLRDKYNSAHRRQRSGERGKLPQNRSVGLSDFSGTWQKADLFQQVLGRFERRIDALEEKESQVEAAGTDREFHRGRPKGDAGRRSQSAVPKGPGRAAQYAHGRGTAGHFASANRRFQAQRDARR